MSTTKKVLSNINFIKSKEEDYKLDKDIIQEDYQKNIYNFLQLNFNKLIKKYNMYSWMGYPDEMQNNLIKIKYLIGLKFTYNGFSLTTKKVNTNTRVFGGDVTGYHLKPIIASEAIYNFVNSKWAYKKVGIGNNESSAITFLRKKAYNYFYKTRRTDDTSWNWLCNFEASDLDKANLANVAELNKISIKDGDNFEVEKIKDNNKSSKRKELSARETLLKNTIKMMQEEIQRVQKAINENYDISEKQRALLEFAANDNLVTFSILRFFLLEWHMWQAVGSDVLSSFVQLNNIIKGKKQHIKDKNNITQFVEIVKVDYIDEMVYYKDFSFDNEGVLKNNFNMNMKGQYITEIKKTPLINLIL